MSVRQRVEALERKARKGSGELPLLVVRTYDQGASYVDFEGQTYLPHELDAARETHRVLVLEYVEDWRS